MTINFLNRENAHLRREVDGLRWKLDDIDRRLQEREERRVKPYRKVRGNRHAVATMVAQGDPTRVATEEEWDTSGWSMPVTTESSELSDYKSDN